MALHFPSDGRRAEDFFARKIQRLLPGSNLWTRVPKANTLTSRPPKLLDYTISGHKVAMECMCNVYIFIYNIHTFLYNIFIYSWCIKNFGHPHHTLLVRSIPIVLWQFCYTNTSFSYQALSLILPALSQTVSMLLWASLTLHYM